MFTSWEVTPTCSLICGGQAPLEICRWMLLAQDQPPPVSSHTDGLVLWQKCKLIEWAATSAELLKRLRLVGEGGNSQQQEEQDTGGEISPGLLTCARLLLVYQGFVNGGTVKGCFKRTWVNRPLRGSDKSTETDNVPWRKCDWTLGSDVAEG